MNSLARAASALALAALAGGCARRPPTAPPVPPPLRLEKSLPVEGSGFVLLPRAGDGEPPGWALFSGAPASLTLYAPDGSAAPQRPVGASVVRDILAAAGGFYAAQGDAMRVMDGGGERLVPLGERVKAIAAGPGLKPWIITPSGARPLGEPASAARPAQALGGWGDDLWLLTDREFRRASDGARAAPPPPGDWRGATAAGFLTEDARRLRFFDAKKKRVTWTRRRRVAVAWVGGAGDSLYIAGEDGLLHALRARDGFEYALGDLGQRGRIFAAPWGAGLLVAAAEGQRLLWLAPGRPPAVILLPGGGRIAGLAAAGGKLAILAYRRDEKYSLDLYLPG